MSEEGSADEADTLETIVGDCEGPEPGIMLVEDEEVSMVVPDVGVGVASKEDDELTSNEIDTAEDELAAAALELAANAELDTDSLLGTALEALEELEVAMELDAVVLDTTSDGLGLLGSELLVADEAREEVEEAWPDDEGLASQFPKPC